METLDTRPVRARHPSMARSSLRSRAAMRCDRAGCAAIRGRPLHACALPEAGQLRGASPSDDRPRGGPAAHAAGRPAGSDPTAPRAASRRRSLRSRGGRGVPGCLPSALAAVFHGRLLDGSRPGELAALKWGDVELRRGSLRVRAGRYRGREGSPKTESSVRDVDLLPPVVEALLAHRAAQAAARLAAGQGAPDPGRDYVFTMPSGRCVDPNRLREQVWNRTIARAGVRRRTMYQTRHTFASNALAAGEAPSWVAAMLGHTTPEMLFQVYARFIPNRTRRDGSALAGRMMSNSQGARTPDLLPSSEENIPEPWKIASLATTKCERGDLNPPGSVNSLRKPRRT